MAIMLSRIIQLTDFPHAFRNFICRCAKKSYRKKAISGWRWLLWSLCQIFLFDAKNNLNGNNLWSLSFRKKCCQTNLWFVLEIYLLPVFFLFVNYISYERHSITTEIFFRTWDKKILSIPAMEWLAPSWTIVQNSDNTRISSGYRIILWKPQLTQVETFLHIF